MQFDGLLLRSWRRKRALTTSELAERSHVSTGTINRLEVGARQPQPATLRKLAAALAIDPAELFSSRENGDQR